jgi:predicted xylose isomerase-like sugar epimerase
VIDITTFLQSLQRMGYDGPVVVEPFSAEVNALPASERVQAVAQSLSGVLARAGIEPTRQ